MQGHLHPDCPKDQIGRFRLDHDNAHWIGPYDPDHTPDDEVDFPEEEHKRAGGSPYPAMHKWSTVGIIQDGLHGGPPLYHISCMYELQPIGKGEGGFGCIAVSTHAFMGALLVVLSAYPKLVQQRTATLFTPCAAIND